MTFVGWKDYRRGISALELRLADDVHDERLIAAVAAIKNGVTAELFGQVDDHRQTTVAEFNVLRTNAKRYWLIF